MEWVFRKLAAEPAAGPGETLLAPAGAEDRQRRDLAALALQKGPAAFAQGPPPVQRIVLGHDPTFDDMLAAAFIERQLRGEPLPAGCQPFARYAGLLREGLRPGQFPLEQSIEGIYLAIRGETEADKIGLDNPDAGRKFLANWERMAAVIFQAAGAGTDPFATPLFAAGHEFARERAFLAKDLDVYRLDFAQGEAWRVQLPGLTALLHGLLLRRPKALLFKYWTRMQCPAPMNGPYPFLAVDWGNGQWVFSTDPVQKLSLKPLAELLEASEPKTPEDAGDPWFDGKPFGHTLVASPRRGTKLPESAVLRLVKKWCRARPVVERSRLPRYLAVAACVLAALGFWVWHAHFREPELLDVHDLHLFAVGVSIYEDTSIRHLPAAASDADALVEAFETAEASKKEEDRLFKKVYCCEPLKNREATRENILVRLQAFLNDKGHPRVTSRSLLIIALSGHGLIDSGSNAYHFAPYDYQAGKAAARGLYLADLQRCVSDLPCSVIILFDTCKSGAATAEREAAEREHLRRDVEKFVSDSGKRFLRDQKALVVIAACGSEQVAMERESWGHGALALALLEAIKGKHLYSREESETGPPIPVPTGNSGGVLTVEDVDRYVTMRVEQLTSELHDELGRKQRVHAQSTGTVTPAQIPLVRR